MFFIGRHREELIDKARDILFCELSFGQFRDHEGVITRSVDQRVNDSLRITHAPEIYLIADQQEYHTQKVEHALRL